MLGCRMRRCVSLCGLSLDEKKLTGLVDAEQGHYEFVGFDDQVVGLSVAGVGNHSGTST